MTEIILRKEFKQQISVYELISWHEATLLSYQSTLPDILPLSPLSVALRCYETVRGVAYLRKCLREGKALCVYISNSRSSLQNRALDSSDLHGSGGALSHDREDSRPRMATVMTLLANNYKSLSGYCFRI